MSSDEVAEAIRRGRPLQIAPADVAREISWSRTPAPDEWLLDGENEGSLSSHGEAHAAGRASEAAVAYGAGTQPEAVAERLLGLADLSARTGLLRAVMPVPGEGDSSRPGSWGVEDLALIALSRYLFGGDVRIRPCWRLLGPAACQVAVAFGANDWLIPEDDQTDPDHLAEAIGCRAVER